MENIVLDTNCLVISFSRRSPYFKIWQDFFDGKFNLCITNEILGEYEEILTQKLGNKIASNILSAILNSSNVTKLTTYFHFNLIKQDQDDNKFVDCAIIANAKYIVTEDHHFDILKQTPFPHIDVIGIDDFLAILNNEM